MALNKSKPYNIEWTQSDEDYSAEWEETLTEDKLKACFFGDSVQKWSSLTKPTVELVLNLCKEFQYSPEIEFTAYNTLDIFFAKIFTKMAKRQLHFFNFQLKQDVVLKVFNVVMICAKYSSQYAVVPLDEMVTMLRKVGCQCNAIMLKESEFYVFSLIDFEIYPPVAFEAANFVVRKVFQGNDVKVMRLMDACVLLMRFIFLEREAVFEKVKQAGINHCDKIEFEECFLAAVVLLAGAKIVRLDEKDYLLLIETLYLHFQVLKREVFLFSNILFELVLNQN